jgi:hypothetical protein
MRHEVETTAQGIQEESKKGWKSNNIFKSITKTRQLSGK